MKLRVLKVACLLLVAWGLAEAKAQGTRSGEGEFRITNFVSGPVCQDPDLVDERRQTGDPPSDRICPGTDIPILGRDACVWSGEHRRCTWYGWEFDYENADPAVPIVCIWTRSHPSDQGNWEGIQNRGLASDTVDMVLPQRSGHMFSPGYDLYVPVTVPWGVIRLDYDCTYRGAPAFQASYRLLYSNAFQ